MNNDFVFKIFAMITVPFLFVVFIMHFIKKIAFHIGAIDIPNKRKVHTEPIPRLGGVGIFLGVLLGYMLFGTSSSIMNAILIGGFVIVLTGIVDDINPVPAIYKFSGQIIAALIIVYYGGLVLTKIDAFKIYISFGAFSKPITIFFIIGCINAMNFVDGLDGLAGGISSIYFLTIAIIAYIQNKFGLDFVLTLTMLGSTLGFLVHNFYPASIFMGDSGSMFLGYIIAIIALLGFKNVTMTSLIIPLLILAIPILDVLFAILRRWIKGQKISTPDKFHIHHQLLNRNLSQGSVVLIIYIINLLFAFASIIYVTKSANLGYIVYFILMVIIIIFVLKTNVVIEHKKHKIGVKRKKSQK